MIIITSRISWAKICGFPAGMMMIKQLEIGLVLEKKEFLINILDILMSKSLVIQPGEI